MPSAGAKRATLVEGSVMAALSLRVKAPDDQRLLTFCDGRRWFAAHCFCGYGMRARSPVCAINQSLLCYTLATLRSNVWVGSD